MLECLLTNSSVIADNAAMARKLEEMSRLLAEQHADRFRVAAYARAARRLRELDGPVAAIAARGGHQALLALPDVGDSIARAIGEMLSTGRWAQLERLRGESSAGQLFQGLPGIGPEFAESIYEHLHADTLEALELAAHDGRLESVQGIGPKRARAIRDALSIRLGRLRPQKADSGGAPSVSLLLDIDARYRAEGGRRALPLIAPKRFNPYNIAWLPILHAERDGWRFTALFSNTVLAHRLKRTDDWVVIAYEDESGLGGQCTLVTETRGPMTGQRVVRGREAECAALATPA